MKRKIIRIDKELCNGCGQCASACHEGAIAMVEGKAELISDTYCDGLGACIGECPVGAISFEEREADAFDEKAVEQHLAKDRLPCGCPGTAVKSIEKRPSDDQDSHCLTESRLTNWPVQLALVPASAPYLKNANLVISADCVPFAHAGFHRSFLQGRVCLIACPKLDETGPYLEKLTEIFRTCGVRSIEVPHMEVPCCSGLVRLVEQAMEKSGVSIPLRLTEIGINGEILETAVK